MPTYSYRCTECSKAFDVQQSFTDASLTVCPSCSGVLRKIFSPIGVSFTGSGFYQNDSRATPTPEKSKSDTESAKPSTTESTPAASPAKESAPAASSSASSTSGKSAASKGESS